MGPSKLLEPRARRRRGEDDPRGIASFERRPRGLEWLHGDLFDSRLDVAMSAWKPVGPSAPRELPLYKAHLVSGQADLKAPPSARSAKSRIRYPGSLLVDC